MKKILITGKGSYIGTYVKKYLESFPEYYVEELDTKDKSWELFDFSNFDVVYHVAGLAHIKEIPENEHLYYEINRDLSIKCAELAKKAGIKQFIFMSSMSVYGLLCSKDSISLDTKCNPNTYYGRSKYEAEIALKELETQDFKVCLARPPMVYGDNSPGNLTKLFNLVRKVHVFPTVKNKRSSITVEQLSMYIKDYIDNEIRGVVLPQNPHYMCTYEIVKKKMKEENVKVVYVSLFNPFIKLLVGKVNLISKCFGDLIYEK